MIQTQVRLEEQDYEAAKKQAQAEGTSLDELIRRALREKLPADADRPWMQYIGMVESGDPDASMTIDDVVYGRTD